MSATATVSPFAAALARLTGKSPVAATLSSEEWAAVPLALRERSFFSARVARAEQVERLQAGLREALALEGETFMDPAKFVATLRRELGAPEGDTGRLTDLFSRRRLELIYKQNVESAREYGRWKSGQAPELRAAYPAQELLRVESREEERDWGMRWADAGGQFYGPENRMIALKGDAVWTKISRFGTPWPPFDFGSGMGVEDVSREEAEELGVIAPGAAAPGAEADPSDDLTLPDLTPLNATLSAGAPKDEALRQALLASLGDKWTIREGRIERQRLFEAAAQMKLPSARSWKRENMPAAPQEITATEGLAKLNAGHVVKTHDLREVKLGQAALAHWKKEKKSPEEVAARAARLSWAEATLSDPAEVWDQGKQTGYLSAFDTGRKVRGCFVAVGEDGEATTYFIRNQAELDKVRKGFGVQKRKDFSR